MGCAGNSIGQTSTPTQSTTPTTPAQNPGKPVQQTDVAGAAGGAEAGGCGSMHDAEQVPPSKTEFVPGKGDVVQGGGGIGSSLQDVVEQLRTLIGRIGGEFGNGGGKVAGDFGPGLYGAIHQVGQVGQVDGEFGPGQQPRQFALGTYNSSQYASDAGTSALQSLIFQTTQTAPRVLGDYGFGPAKDGKVAGDSGPGKDGKVAGKHGPGQVGQVGGASGVDQFVPMTVYPSRKQQGPLVTFGRWAGQPLATDPIISARGRDILLNGTQMAQLPPASVLSSSQTAPAVPTSLDAPIPPS